MAQADILEKQIDGNGEIKIESYKIDYKKLQGRGGSFLVVPIGEGTVFSREQFTEEHIMFEQTAKEFAENRIFPVREKLNVLNKDLSLEIFKEMGELGFLCVDLKELRERN